MLRNTLLLLLFLGSASPSWAHGWAEGLFEELTFDFGSVQRGTECVHPFRIVNNTKYTVRITRVGVSCNCTEAHALHYVLAPGQETAIIAQMHSRVFEGVRAVTIYVGFDQPAQEEVRLSVQANSRTSDLQFTPDHLNFDKIKHGSSPTKQMTIAFPYHPQAQVVEVKCDSNYIQPKVKELSRVGGATVYQVAATLRSDIPEGKWYTDIWLKTNIPAMPRLRVPLSVEVEAPARPAPPPAKAPVPPPPTPVPTPPANPPQKTAAQNVVLKSIRAGTQSEQQVILRSELPFRITSIEGGNDEVLVRETNTERATVHVLTLTFRPSQPGQLNRTIRVHTDLVNNRDFEFNAQVQIQP